MQTIVIYDVVESWTEREIKDQIEYLLGEEFMTRKPTTSNGPGEKIIKITITVQVEEVESDA